MKILLNSKKFEIHLENINLIIKKGSYFSFHNKSKNKKNHLIELKGNYHGPI